MLPMNTVADLKKREALQAYLSIGTLLGTTGKGDMSPLAPRRAVVSFSTIKVPAMLNASVSPILPRTSSEARVERVLQQH